MFVSTTVNKKNYLSREDYVTWFKNTRILHCAMLCDKNITFKCKWKPVNMCAKIGLRKAQLHQQSCLSRTERKQEVEEKHLIGEVRDGDRQDKPY